MVTVTLGTGLGVLIGTRITARMKTTAFVALGLVDALLGIQMALKTEQLLIPMVSLLLGGLIGEALQLEERLNALGSRLSGGKGKFTEGFIATSLLFCVGAMTVLGALEEGLKGTFEIFALKAALDGVAAVAFASTFGWGVGLSAVTILLVQGGLTLSAGLVQPLLTPQVVAEVSATGGLILLALALQLLDIKKVPIASFLPALLLPICWCPFSQLSRVRPRLACSIPGERAMGSKAMSSERGT
ncbi:putative membrane protein YdfK [compost metagenome]